MPITTYAGGLPVVPKGRIYFADDVGDADFEDNENYIGESNPFTINVVSNQIDVLSAECGVDEVIARIAESITRNAALTVQNLSDAALRWFFIANSSTLTKTLAAAATDTVIMKPGEYTQIGADASYVAGTRQISNVTAVGLTEGTDYQVDEVYGRVYAMTAAEGGAITLNQSVLFTYDQAATTWSQIVSGRSKPYEGPIRFLPCNYISGAERDYFFPSCILAPNGDFTAKQLGANPTALVFALSILKPTDGREAMYVGGVPT